MLAQEPQASIGPAPKLKVAVIGVHGVGNHPRYETAREIADLLIRFKPMDGASFRELDLRIPVGRAPVRDDASKEKVRKFPAFLSFDQRSPSIRTLQGATPREAKATTKEETAEKATTKAPDTSEADAVGFRIMEDRLRQYVPDGTDQVYESIRCECVLTPPLGPSIEVHVYEMFWSDLSSFGTGIALAFMRLFSLIFDLCLLGRQTLDAVVALNPNKRSWRWMLRFQTWAELTLTQPIVLMNVLILLLVCYLSLPFAPGWLLHYAGIALIPIMASAVVLWVFSKVHRTTHRLFWFLLLPFLVAIDCVLVAAIDQMIDPSSRENLLDLCSFDLTLALGSFYALFVRWYGKRKLGAGFLGAVLGLSFLGVLIRERFTVLGGNDCDSQLVDHVMRIVEFMYYPLGVAWSLYWGLALGVVIFGFAATSAKLDNAKEKEKERRAAWTANLTVFLSGAASLATTGSSWGAIFLVVSRAFRTHFEQGIHHPFLSGAKTSKIADALPYLVQHMLSVLPRIEMILVVGGIVATWALLPSILSEFKFPLKPRAATGEKAKWLGANLTEAYRFLRVAGELVRWLIVASSLWIMGLGIIMWHDPKRFSWASAEFPYLFTFEQGTPVKMAIVIGGSIVLALFATREAFQFLVLGFYSALQAAIDVVNWMRVHPLDRNPQARICARFCSLLRNIVTWRSPVDGEAYAGIVIVAHSQGTVITADLLRFLEYVKPQAPLEENDPLFSSRNIRFLTMGCPLRQIYSVRFPHIYGWARGCGTTPFEAPDRTKLYGVVDWTNVYRSGDYVGRTLWHSEKNEDSWTLDPSTVMKEKEFCAGEGAHTHYWDDSAELVASELSRQIQSAVNP
jgi:hypothetical protein